MNCDLEQLQRYHDGELDAASSRDIEAHLLQCDACRKALDELGALSAMFASAPLPEVDSQRLARIANAAWHEASDRGVRRLAGWITAAAAAVMVFALIDFPQGQRHGNGGGAEQTAMVSSPSIISADWEQAAIMPPAAVFSAEEPNREMVQFVQWMASDLSNGAEPARQR